MKILPIHVYSCPLLLPLCQDVPGQAHTQPSWLCTSCPRNQPTAPSHWSRCGAVSVPPDPACEMYANGSERWVMSGRDTKGPLNLWLPRALTPARRSSSMGYKQLLSHCSKRASVSWAGRLVLREVVAMESTKAESFRSRNYSRRHHFPEGIKGCQWGVLEGRERMQLLLMPLCKMHLAFNCKGSLMHLRCFQT